MGWRTRCCSRLLGGEGRGAEGAGGDGDMVKKVIMMLLLWLSGEFLQLAPPQRVVCCGGLGHASRHPQEIPVTLIISE